MEENNSTVTEERSPGLHVTEGAADKKPKKKPDKKRRKTVKTIIIIVIIAAVAGAITFGIYRLFSKKEEVGIMTEFLYRGPLQSIVQGSGVATPKDSANIVVKAKGEVKHVYVEAGQAVTAGTKLYEIESSTAQSDLDEAEKKLSNLNKELQNTYEKIGYLNITAPHSGKLMEVISAKPGDKITEGTKIAVLCDDSKMKLTQYFSYAYENDIKTGMSADISIPGSMAVIKGTVNNIEKVRKITPEGTVLFEVEFILDNPGALSKDMAATASMTAEDGALITPAEAGKLAYNNETEMLAKASGTVAYTNYLKNYYDVKSGTVLINLESDVFDDEVRELEKQIETAAENLKEKQDMFDSFNAVSPIDGIVMNCSLLEGQTVETGTVAITISDITEIMVEAQIDEMDVNKISPQMMVEIIRQEKDGESIVIGVVDSVSLEGKYENGMSYFPAIIKVPNEDGSLKPNMWVSFRIVASEKDDCLIAPIQSIKYTEFGTCLFVRDDRPYENIVELGEGAVPEGFVAISVETGIGNDTGVEITGGAEEGYEVYTQAANQNPWGYYG